MAEEDLMDLIDRVQKKQKLFLEKEEERLREYNKVLVVGQKLHTMIQERIMDKSFVEYLTEFETLLDTLERRWYK